MAVDGEEFSYMKAKLEEIARDVCEIKPIASQIATLMVTIQNIVEQVRNHAATLYGEKTQSGLVGRVERVEGKVNQVLAILGLLGTSFLIWIVGRFLGLISP